jgi:hypothetical protein
VLGLALAVALMLAAYAVAANAWWVGDDYNYVVPKGWAQVLNLFNPVGRPQYRPLNWLTWAADWALFGPEPLGWRLTAYAMHGLNIISAALLGRAITGRADVALLGAALFGVHPALTEDVTWTSGRNDVSFALAWLPALWLWVRWRQGAGRRTGLAAIVRGVISILGKETAVLLPLASLWIEVIFGRGWARWPGRRDAGWWRDPATWLRLLRDHLPFIGISVGYVALRVGLALTAQGRLMYGEGQLGFLAHPLEVVAGYMVLATGAWQAVPLVGGWPLAVRVGIVVAGGLIAVGAVRWLGRFALFALGWIALTLVLTTQAVAYRWFYVPALGVAWLIAWAWAWLWDAHRRARRAGRGGTWPSVAALAVLVISLGGWSALTVEMNVRWVESGREAQRLLAEIRALVPDPPRPATFYMANPPYSYQGVLLFNSGFGSCINLLYHDWTTIRAYELRESAAQVGAALADPARVGPNPVFLRYEDGHIVRYPSLRALYDRQQQGRDGWSVVSSQWSVLTDH